MTTTLVSASVAEPRGRDWTTRRRLIGAAGAAAALSATANALAAFALAGPLAVRAGYPPLNPFLDFAFTAVGVGLAAVVLGWMGRISENPMRLFTIVAAIGIPVSYLAPAIAYFVNLIPGTNLSRTIALMGLHTIAGVIAIVVLRAFAPLRITRTVADDSRG